MPANETSVAPRKALPEIVTLVPADPVNGVKPSIRGATENGVGTSSEPPSRATVTGPLVAPFGTTAWIWSEDRLVNAAADPLKRTPVTPSSPLPLMVIASPTRPADGDMSVSVGL